MILLFLNLISYKNYVKILFSFQIYFKVYVSHVRTFSHSYLINCPQCMKEMNRCMKWNVKVVKLPIHWVEKTHSRFIYQHWLQERFKALTIYLKVIPILDVTYLNRTMWKHDLYNKWPSPSRFQLSWKNMKPRIIEWDFLSEDKSFSHDKLIMKNLNPTFCYFSISSNLKICNFWRSSALSKSKFSCLIVHKTQCSNSIGRWQAFSKTNLYRDILRTVLKAIL